MNDKTLFIIRGLPGSGKSSTAELLAENKWPITSEDTYYYLEDGSYLWTEQREVTAREKCLQATCRLMNHNIEKVFVTNVFSTFAELKPYFKVAEHYQYNIVTILSENWHDKKSIHNVDLDDFNQMHKRFQVKLAPNLQ